MGHLRVNPSSLRSCGAGQPPYGGADQAREAPARKVAHFRGARCLPCGTKMYVPMSTPSMSASSAGTRFQFRFGRHFYDELKPTSSLRTHRCAFECSPEATSVREDCSRHQQAESNGSKTRGQDPSPLPGRQIASRAVQRVL